jgi:hypothetical protein
VLYSNCIIIHIDKLSYCQFIEPIGGVMFSVLASSAVDRGVEALSTLSAISWREQVNFQ